MKNYIAALIVATFLIGCGSGQKDKAYFVVTTELQAKQSLFKDQYDLSMPFDNDRGSVVVAEITDKKLISDNGNKFIVHLLTKQQDGSGIYVSGYSRVFLKEKPSKEKIKELASSEHFL